MMAIRIGVHGACGRMGQFVVRLVAADSECQLAAALEAAGHPRAGQDIGGICGLPALGVEVSSELPAAVDAVIDFSVPSASLALVEKCRAKKIPVVVATTGHEPEEREKLVAASKEIPMLIAANLSWVVNILFKLAKETGRVLRGRDYDVEIIEHHHRHKVDSPSGTALRFAEIVEKEMALTRRQHGREGIVGARPRNELGLHAVRGGDNVGEHRIIFSTMGETLELVHRSSSRESYAAGAVAGAKFLVGKKPGLYSMEDVLGLG